MAEEIEQGCFMSYVAFLVVMSQLDSKKTARILVKRNEILIEPSKKKNTWMLCTKVFSGDPIIPRGVRSCISTSGVFRWQHRGAYLKLDAASHSVYLTEEVEMERGKYLPFKHHIGDFATVADEWRAILQEFADRDCIFSRYPSN